MASCQSTNKIELPPKPERQYIDAPKDLKDCAKVINYYEHKLQEYEKWADTVIKILEAQSK